jgi:hypothetical protein
LFESLGTYSHQYETTLAETHGEEPTKLAGNGTAEDSYLVTAVAEWNAVPDNADGHDVLSSGPGFGVVLAVLAAVLVATRARE